MKPIYSEVNWDVAWDERTSFAASPLCVKYLATVKTFEDASERPTLFLAFPPEPHRVLYTTNSIKSLNCQLRKVTKNRGHFPSDESVVKMLWLAICNIEDKRARDRAKEHGDNRQTKPRLEGRLVEGQIVTNWKLALAYPDRDRLLPNPRAQASSPPQPDPGRRRPLGNRGDLLDR